MKKPDFERCTKEATKLLCRQNLSDRILNVAHLTYEKSITFDTIRNYCLCTNTSMKTFLSNKNQILKDGCTIYDLKSDYYIVLYNENTSYFEHLNWTLAHEIGHIYLGHIDDGDLEEIEAHFFASQLFMPEYSIYMTTQKYGSITDSDLVEIFGVSREAAIKRLNTMNRRTCISSSQADKDIWEKQRRRIDMYFECKKEGHNFRDILPFFLQMQTRYESKNRLEAYSHILTN